MSEEEKMMQDAPVHKRRKRYSGTHPHKYSEKYKELNPEKYKEDVEKIIGQGKTPAGTHISICVKEILEVLRIQPGEIGLDCTLGYGGHTGKMLECLEGKGHMYATDVDPIESVKTKERLAKRGFGEEILTIKHLNFANIDEVADNGEKFDFVLADLGVSSMQIDNPERGFTFKQDGPLDLRMDPTRGKSAAERLHEMTQDEIEGMLIDNADEPNADRIAKAIVKEKRKGVKITSTQQLYHIIEDAIESLPGRQSISKEDRKTEVRKSCQRCFQALRIDVNSEYEVLFSLLDKLPLVLSPGGRVAILTFHSGEDRLVKNAFRYGKKEGLYSEIAEDPIRPSKEECYINPRAHSAKLRYAIRAAE